MFANPFVTENKMRWIVTQKRFLYVLLVTVLGLLLLATAVSAAQGGGKTGEAVRVRGQAPAAHAGVKPAAAPSAPKQLRPPSSAAKMGIAPQAAGPFVYRLHETFEGIWPTPAWNTFDNDPAGSDVCWDDENWIAFQGAWSGFGAGGCADGVDPNIDYYPDYVDSWAVVGPFSTEGAKSGEVQFKFWSQTEEDYDYFYYCASVDDATYYCKYHTGDSEGWRNGRLNLRGMPFYGNMLGEEQVWVAFIFYSDYSNVDDGTFIDQVRIVVKK